MKQIFQCQKCRQIFSDKNSCSIHEQICQSKIPIRAFVININTEQNLQIEIHDYPDAYLLDQECIKLFNDYCAPKINKNFLEKIHRCGYEYEGDYCTKVVIYSNNFNEDHQNECIEKLLKFKRQKLIEQRETRLKDIDNNIRFIDNRTFKIEHYNNSRYDLER